ncbi:MAG: hypothetical protein GQ477_00475 [Nanohaloarchaea archaeon]|nr:hypothetical protein [Candidatus Nanohaloarchaea archaeon]
MNRYIMFFAFLIIFISGCTDGSNSDSSVSGNEETEISVSDILSINDFQIIPSETITPDRSFILRLEVENIGNNPVILKVDDSGAYDGDMILFNTCGIFHLDDDNSFIMNPSHSGKPSEIEIKSRMVQYFEWKMRAPSEGLVTELGTICDFTAQFSYDAVASTNTYVYFATPFEILRSFYTKKNMYLLGSNIATDGPLKVNIVPDVDQPVAMDNYAWTASINIENVGDGLAEVKSLKLILPDEIDYVSGVDCDLDKAENLEIRNGGSNQISCMFTPPNEDVLIATAYKIKAVAEYTYTVTDSIQVTVKP